MARYLRHPPSKHATAALVAAATLALALGDGGSAPTAYSVEALALWALILVGVAAGFLPRAAPPSSGFAAGACLVAFALISGLSAIWASDAGAAFDETVVALGYAGLFVGVLIGSRRGEAGPWLAGLAIGLGLVAVLALGARLEPSIFGDGEAALLERLPAAQGRLSDPFLYWNALAAAMATALVLLGWLAAGTRERIGRSLAVAAIPLAGLTLYMTTSRGGAAAALLGLAVLILGGPRRVRLAGALAIGLAGTAALIVLASTKDALLDLPLSELARSQAGGLELAIVLVVLACGGLAYGADPLLGRLKAPSVRIPAKAAIAAVLLAVIAVVIVANPAERWEEFKSPPSGGPVAGEARDLLSRGGSSGRYQFWESAVDAFGEQPLRGVGAAGYESHWNQNGTLEVPGPNGHSLLFDTAAELGLLGLAAILAFASICVVVAIRRLLAIRRAPGELDDDHRGELVAVIGVLVAGFAGASVDWLWENPAAFGPIIVAAALLTGPATAPGPATPAAAGERRSRRRFAGGVVVLAFAWVAICASTLLLLTNLSLSSSRGSFADGELDGAAGSAQNAIDVQPWAAEPHQQLGLVREAQGDLPGAEEEIDKAIDRSPEDWRLWLIAARLRAAAGDEEGALADAERARSLAPRIPVFDQPISELVAGL